MAPGSRLLASGSRLIAKISTVGYGEPFVIHRRTTVRERASVVAALLITLSLAPNGRAQSPSLELRKGDHIVFVGNTMAERLQQFNYFETMLMVRFPDLDLVVRNLGWSGDTITLQPRPLNFGDAAKHLKDQKADVIFAFFGLNESFDGEAGLPAFEKNLDAYLASHQQAQYSDRGASRVVLISPIAHERIARLEHYVDVDARNRELSRYTESMRRVAAARHVTFVDLFTPTKKVMERAGEPLTINGIHVNEAGDRIVADLLMGGLGFQPPGQAAGVSPAQFEQLRDLVRDKNQQFFYRWRPVNGEYVVGRRIEPFGVVNFPPEMRKLDEMVAERDRRIWTQARSTGGGSPTIGGRE
jgi:lysophospholipase L1-like esterase